MKNKKAIEPIMTFFIILGIITLLGGGYYFAQKTGLVQTQLTSSCQLVSNPSIAPYWQIIQGTPTGIVYTCPAGNECIISADMTLNKTTTVGEYTIYNVCNMLSDCTGASKEMISCVVPYGKSCGTVSRFVGNTTIYLGRWFLSQSNGDQSYNPGTDMAGMGTHVLTDVIKLNGNTNANTVTFQPKYTDGSIVEQYNLKVKKYDCACAKLQLSNPSKYCDLNDSSKKYCTPKYTVTQTCADGTAPKTLPCYIIGAGTQTLANKCCNGWVGATCNQCVDPIQNIKTNYSYYSDCGDATETQFSGAVCNIFKINNGTKLCDPGLQCLVNGVPGSGLGGCGCANLGYNIGDVVKDPANLPRGYIKYVASTGANNCPTPLYSSCPIGTLFDEVSKKCILDQTDTCASSPLNSKKCLDSKNYKVCTIKIINDQFCLNGQCSGQTWSGTGSCGGNTTCESGVNGDSCACPLYGSCAIGTIKCNAQGNGYQTCIGADFCGYSGNILLSEGYGCQPFKEGNYSNVITSKPGCINNNPGPAEYQICDFNLNSPTYNTNICKTTGIASDGNNYCKEGDLNIIKSESEYQSCEIIPGSLCRKYVTHTCSADQRTVQGSLNQSSACTCRISGPTIGGSTYCQKGDSNILKSESEYQSCEIIPGSSCSRYVTHYCLSDQKTVPGSLTPLSACTCKTTTPYCTKGAVNIGSGSNYQVCEQNTSTGCYKYNSYTCSPGSLFIANTYTRSTACTLAGCAYPNGPDYNNLKCSEVKDANNLLIENCNIALNKCEPINDLFFVNDTRTSKCVNNSIYISKAYTGKSGTINRWIPSQTCSGEYPICISGSSDGINLMSDSSTAQCVAPGDVTIICDKGNCDYGLNEQLNNITITVKPTLGNVSRIETKVQILSGTTVLGSTQTFFTNNEGQIKLSCPGSSSYYCYNYNFTKSGNYELRVTILSLNKTVSKNITVKPTLRLTLSCDSKSYAINRPARCSWKVEDRDKPLVFISATPTILITQGEKQITQFTQTTSSVDFTTTDMPGSMDVQVTVTKEGYNPDTKIYSLTITDLERTQSLFVDNVNFAESDNQLSLGSHTLKLSVLESGQSVDIQSIDANIKTPSGEITDLTFIKSGNDWIATSDKFAQPGQSYFITGNIKFTDLTKDDLPFDYTLNTKGNVTDKPTANLNFVWWIIGGVVGVVLILVIVGFVFRKK